MSRFIVAFAERRGQRHDQIARGKLGDSVDMPHGFANDPDTDRLLSLVPWNLHRFFGHDEAAAAELVRSSYASFQTNWGDDFYHHEGPYRCAARLADAGAGLQ